MRTNLFISIFFLSVWTLFAQDLVLDPIPPMTPHGVVDQLPYVDTALQTSWAGSEPTGWNAMSVNVDFMTGVVKFTYPSLWQYNAGNANTEVNGATYLDHMVHALLLPLIKVPTGVATVKVNYSYKVETTNAESLESNMLVAFATDGAANRNDAKIFMDACLANFGAGSNPADQQWTAVSQEFNMTDFPSRELNVVLMAMQTSDVATNFSFKDVSVVDPNTSGCIKIESADKNISVSNGQIRIVDLSPNAQVALISASGSILSQQYASSNMTIDVAQRGLYLVRITQDGKQSLSKVMIP